MIHEMTCIVCPNGCHLKVDDALQEVTGNKCPRGKKYALEELVRPMRTITSTVRCSLPGTPVASVRSAQEIPKELLPQAMKEINAFVLKEKLPIGSVLLPHLAGTDVPLILTADIL